MQQVRLRLNHFSHPGAFLLFLLYLQSSMSYAQTVLVQADRYLIDQSLKLIICNQIPSFPTGHSLPTIRFDKDYLFTQSVSAFEAGKAYPVKSGSTDYTLFFTNLPLVKINTAGKQAISNTDARTKGTFTLVNGTDPLFTSSMGIRIRGNASRLFPKKQYNVQLWQDPNGDEERETSLLGLREDSKWLLFAMYNEPLRIQNATSQAVWLNMHKLYYQNSEPDANSGLRTKYCDVFINDVYAGIYMLGEDLDRKQLKLKKTANNGSMRGELYKTEGGTEATGFTSLPPAPTNPNAETWAGFEMDYPDPYWNNLYALLNYAIKSPADEFSAKLSEHFRVDNLIDYYIFLNLVYATDHWGNNQFVARYKENEPYFLIPWDLDGVFGYGPTGTFFEESRLLGSNGLFNRLLSLDPGGFKSKMRKRWFALRQNELSQATLKNALAVNFNLLTAEGAYAREALKWPGTVTPEQLPAVNTWLENRLMFLDEYFALFPQENAGIKLAYFQGEAVSGSKKLKWAFLTGTEAKTVTVESSTNGLDFTPVETVAVNSGNAPGPYELTHSYPSSPAFYRLKIFTSPDAFSYSPHIQIGSNTCPSPPAAPSIRASITDVIKGESVVLTAAGCSQTVIWSTGQTGAVLVVNPTETTTYSAKCRQAAGCESSASSTVKVNVFADAIPGSFEGYLGAVECDFIRGWAWDRNKPNTPVYIDILDGQKVIGTTIAGIFRQDLKNASKGNGSHSYMFAAPEVLKNNLSHSISARIHGTTFVLRDSPKNLVCPGINTPPTGGQPPVAPSVSALTATVNTPFSATLPAFTDPDSPSLTYALMGLPASLNFSADTRIISGTPTATAALSLTYSASDGTTTTKTTLALTIGNQPVVSSADFEGFLDKVECESIRGWVWNRNKPNDALTVEFFANGQSIGTARADIFRQDLKDAGKGNGYHVYNFPTPSSAKTGQAVELSAKVQNSSYFLKQSPKSLTCPGSGTTANQPPQAPVSVLPLSATVNSAFSAVLPAFTDLDSPSLTYALLGLPASLSFTAGTRTISGIPTTTATLSLTYTASDGALSSSTIVPLTINPAATPTVTGNFEGYLDKVECGSIRGWVWDRNKPNEAYTVEFFANGQSIGTARADIFRQDLKDAGKGNGYHVYNFPTPVSVKTGQTFQISAKVQYSNYTLAWSPKSLNCAPNARLSADWAGESDPGLLVTPNPTNGEFEVHFTKTAPNPGELSIVDEAGQVWYTKTVEGTGSHRHKVRLSGANGLYLIRLQDDQQVRTRKILIGR